MCSKESRPDGASFASGETGASPLSPSPGACIRPQSRRRGQQEGGPSRSTPPGAGKCEVRCEIKGARPRSVPLIAWCESEGLPFSFPFNCLSIAKSKLRDIILCGVAGRRHRLLSLTTDVALVSDVCDDGPAMQRR